MSDHLDKFDCNYEKLFASIPHTKNKEVLQRLEEIYNDYQDYKKDKKEFMFFDKALGEPGQKARYGLIDELDYKKIKLGDIVEYINQVGDYLGISVGEVEKGGNISFPSREGF